ncbi:hypothetical protein M885DRAFT_592117, partial [Pelagophyceae sp. CCMP2097]
MIAATLYQIPLQDRDPHADAKVDAAVPSFPVVPKAVGANAGKAPKLAAAKAAGKPPATAKAAEETLAVADRRRMPAAAKAPAAAAAKAPAEAPAKAPTAPAAQAHKKPVAAAKAADKTPRNGVAAKDVQHEFSEEFLVGTGKKLLESSPELMTQGLRAVPKMLEAIAAKVGLPKTHALEESESLTDAISRMMNTAATEEEEAQRKKVPKKT